MLKGRDRESRKRRRKKEMTAGRRKDGRGLGARRGVRPDINAAVLIPFLVASPAAATSADCCLSISKDWGRLSAPFAEGGIRRPLSADVKCRQMKRAIQWREKGKSGSEKRACVTCLLSSPAAPCSRFLINEEESDKMLLLFPTLKWQRTLVQPATLSLFFFSHTIKVETSPSIGL